MPKRLNLVDNIYGELKVIEMLWNYNNTHRTYCKCIGINDVEYKEYIVRQDSLQNGTTHTTSGANTGGKFHDLTGKKFGLLTVIKPTEKRASNGGIIWDCLCDCGNHSYPNGNNLEKGHSMSCGCRHISKCENLIYNQLTFLNINFDFQKRFDDCRNLKGSDMLPFDFYLPKYNTIIEYDGLHHFEPIKGWGGEEKFKITKQNDKIKNDFCKNNDIKLIRIPYTRSQEEIIQIINNIMHPATITA